MKSLLLRLVAFVILAGIATSATCQTPDCSAIKARVDANLESVTRLFDIANNTTCLAEYAAILSPKRSVRAQIRPFLSALENYQTNQQNSSGSSTASTSPVSKPGGPTAIIEDFGGFQITPGTSSTTFQFAPGKLLEDLQTSGGVAICNEDLKQTSNCISTKTTKFWLHWTIAASTQTSSTTQSTTGTAGGTTSQAVNVTTGGTANPTFAGITAKWALMGKPKLTESTYSKVAVQAAGGQFAALESCPEYKDVWQANAKKAYVEAAPEAKQKVLDEQYRTLLTMPLQDGSCLKAFFDGAGAVLEDYLIANLVDDVAGAQTPWLGLEYDDTTPVGKPSYSSAKLNFSHQFGKTANVAPSDSTLAPLAATIANGVKSGNAPAALSSDATKKAAANITPPFSINLSLGVDVFNASQTSVAPTASRLRDFQAGAEFDYIIPVVKLQPTSQFARYMVKTIGDPTLAASYLYQDQTSPSILTGPPSTITFVGLPTTAKSAYTTTGPIHLAQLRIGFGTGTNLKFPVAVTYSNRSELVPGKAIGFQLGLSYNLTSGLTSGSK